MSGVAVLKVGFSRNPKSRWYLTVTWPGSNPDENATVEVPHEIKRLWDVGVELVEKSGAPVRVIAPYPNMPIMVEHADLESSATGFYATAREVWDEVSWTKTPPYPVLEPSAEGVN